jgi:hypothetical protein
MLSLVRAPHRSLALVVGAIFAVLFALMTLAGYQNLYALNPDGVAYLRLASYYADGETSLMISSYWGPLLSWWMAPWLWVGVPALATARIAAGLSSLVFLAGCVVLFRCMRLSTPATMLGTGLCALAALSWSLKLNPDLLASGLLAAATGRVLTSRWFGEPGFQTTTGALFGIAYLAKPMALAVALATVVAVSFGRILLRQTSPTGGLRAAVLTLASTSAIVLPWIVLISWHYGEPTLGTSARINHAIVGPHDVDRYHPLLRAFHEPEPGRVTQWEDPSHMGYRYWSATESPAYLRHQFEQVQTNLARIGFVLLTFDHLALGLLALVVAPLAHRPWREGMRRDPWRWAGLSVGITCALYLPFFADEPRYYYSCFPFLVAAGFGLADSWGTARPRWWRLAASTLLVASFLQPTGLLAAARGGWLQGSALRDDYAVAERLREARRMGPIAGVEGTDGLYVAFFVGVPYLGSERRFDPDRLLRSKARLVVVQRDSRPARRLERDARFENLDEIVVGDTSKTRLPGLMVFQIPSERIGDPADSDF